jgi:hypothetical protein
MAKSASIQNVVKCGKNTVDLTIPMRECGTHRIHVLGKGGLGVDVLRGA